MRTSIPRCIKCSFGVGELQVVNIPPTPPGMDTKQESRPIIDVRARRGEQGPTRPGRR